MGGTPAAASAAASAGGSIPLNTTFGNAFSQEDILFFSEEQFSLLAKWIFILEHVHSIFAEDTCAENAAHSQRDKREKKDHSAGWQVKRLLIWRNFAGFCIVIILMGWDSGNTIPQALPDHV